MNTLNENKSDQVGYCSKISYELRWLDLSITHFKECSAPS